MALGGQNGRTAHKKREPKEGSRKGDVKKSNTMTAKDQYDADSPRYKDSKFNFC